MFLKNAWYVAAWEHEITHTLHPVKILGEKIVLYRQENGAAVALEDACAHRKLPLSMGRLRGNQVECGYHGLTFDCSGACTRVPGTDRIPPGARVRSYPVADKYGLLWIWMGQAELADPATIFPVEHWGDPAWGINRGESMVIACNYRYMTDNLLDPSHVAWVHESSFAGPGTADTPVKVSVSEGGVVVSRWMMDATPAPFYVPFLKFKGHCDREQYWDVRFPCNAIIKAVFTPAGTGGSEGALHPDYLQMDSYNFMTPVDENHTRYHWFQMRNFSPDDAQVSQKMADAVRAAFEEDRAILTAVHEGMTNQITPHIDLASDGGPLRFRRKLDQLIDAEKKTQATANERGARVQ